jgi:CxxC motif-containing protein
VTGKENIVCVGCPMGCSVILTVDNDKVIAFEGNKCKQGEKYTIEEYRNPARILSTTLLTTGSTQPLLPVRTSNPIPKSKILEVATILAGITVEPPIKIGETVLSKPCGIPVDIIATTDLVN